jgi:alpha-beta hydrolase superfamily lysophospholipase
MVRPAKIKGLISFARSFASLIQILHHSLIFAIGIESLNFPSFPADMNHTRGSFPFLPGDPVVAASRASWFTDIWTTLAAASGIGYLATAYSVSRWLTRTTRQSPIRPAETPDWSWEDLECRTEDGLRLAGWLVTPPQPRATVALFHGLRGNRARTLGRIGFLAAAGYRCVAFDHRGHGRSEGRWTSFGFHESRDVHAVLDFIDKRWPGQPRLALGISMGAAALCFAFDRARDWDALILESMYHDLAKAFRTRVGSCYPTWFKRFSRGVVWMTERRLGLRLEEMAPIHHIDKLAPTPVLLVTGSDDPHAPPEDVLDLFDHCKGPREISLVSGAGHEDVYEQGGQEYQKLILDFFERWLPTVGSGSH